MRNCKPRKESRVWGQYKHKEQFKWGREPNSPWLGSNTSRFVMLSKVTENISICNLNNEDILREVMVKIELERIDIQEGITVEALLDRKATGLVMSSEFAKKQRLKLEKIERPIYI